jgi:DNA-binding NtrC family response regulator
MPDTRGSLLIVDDDESIRVSLSLIFSALGYRVRSGEDGFSALAEIQNEIPDVLLADVNMARMPGMEFLAAVRRSFPSVRVIAMTGVFSGNRARPDIAADAFYQKGAGPSRLIEYVDVMTQPLRAVSRLSMERSFGQQVFEPIPSHPGAEALAHPGNRSWSCVPPRNEQVCVTFPTAQVITAQEVCTS